MTPCTAPTFAPGSRVQMRYDGRLGRIVKRLWFKPGMGWAYSARFDGSLSPIICTESALRWPELPPLSGNVIALFGAAGEQPEMPGAA